MSTGMTKLLSQFYVPIQVQIQVQIYVQIHVQVHVQIHVQFFMSNLMSSFSCPISCPNSCPVFHVPSQIHVQFFMSNLVSSFSCPGQPKKVSLSASWISKLHFCTYWIAFEHFFLGLPTFALDCLLLLFAPFSSSCCCPSVLVLLFV